MNINTSIHLTLRNASAMQLAILSHMFLVTFGAILTRLSNSL
jgi:hypothetical protein